MLAGTSLPISRNTMRQCWLEVVLHVSSLLSSGGGEVLSSVIPRAAVLSPIHLCEHRRTRASTMEKRLEGRRMEKRKRGGQEGRREPG